MRTTFVIYVVIGDGNMTINKCICQTINKCICQTINKCICQTINKCICQTINKCICQTISKMVLVKTRLQRYHDTSYSRGGVNQMWILKNSKDLLEYKQSRSLSSCNSIKPFDFSTLYTTIPHSKLKDKFRELVQLCFIKKND